MTREEVKNLLGEGATDEQISAVLNKFHTEQKSLTEQVTDLQGQVTNLTTEKTGLIEYKTKFEDLEKANMTEQEQIEKAKKDAIEELSKAKKLTNSIKAKSILIGAGLEEAKADEIVNDIVKDDESMTLKTAQLLAEQFTAVKEATAKKTLEDLSNQNLTPNPSNIPPNSNQMTWDKFSAMSVEEQNKFAEEHPEEFDNL